MNKSKNKADLHTLLERRKLTLEHQRDFISKKISSIDELLLDLALEAKSNGPEISVKDDTEDFVEKVSTKPFKVYKNKELLEGGKVNVSSMIRSSLTTDKKSPLKSQELYNKIKKSYGKQFKSSKVSFASILSKESRGKKSGIVRVGAGRNSAYFLKSK